MVRDDLYARFFQHIDDPVGAELEELNAEVLLELLRLNDPTDIANFGRDFGVPVGRRPPTLTDASRMLSSWRARRGQRGLNAAGWLTGNLAHMLFIALMAEQGMERRGQQEGPTLTEMLDRWGTPALRLTIIGAYRKPGLAGLLVAAAVSDGRLIAASWQDAAVDFAGEAAEAVAGSLESMRDHDDADFDDDELGSDGQEDALMETQDGEELRSVGERSVLGSPPTTERPDPSVGSADLAAAYDGTAVSGADTPLAPEPSAALQSLAEAIADARAALKTRPLDERSVFERFAAVEGAGLVTGGGLAELRALAQRVVTSSPEGDFLTRLAEVIDSGDPDARVRAVSGLLVDPVGQTYGQVVMAAGVGMLRLPPIPTRADAWTEWEDLLAGEAFEQIITRWGPLSETLESAGSVAAPTASTPAGEDAGVGPAPGSLPAAPHTTPEEIADGGGADGVAGAAVTQSPERKEGHHGDAASVAAVIGETGVATVVDGAEDSATPGLLSTVGATVNPGASNEEDATTEASDVAGEATPNRADSGAATAPPAAEASSGSTPAGEIWLAGADISQAWAQLFAEGRWSLGSYFAEAHAAPARARALEAVAVIDTARSDTGLAAIALYDLVGALSPSEIGGDEPMQLIALAAAIRASLVAPFSGATGPLGYLKQFLATKAPALAALADAALAAAATGLALADVVAIPVDDEDRIRRAAEAADWLARPRHTSFDRANRIWLELVAPGGLIHSLVQPVADDDVASAASVREALAGVTPARIDADLRSKDKHLRRGGSKRLEGLAKATLLRWCDDAVRLASAWLRSVDRARRATSADVRHPAAIETLRRSTDALRRDLTDCLAALAGDPDGELAGAALGAGRLIEATLNLIDGTPLPGVEIDPAIAMRLGLLCTGIALGADGLPVDPKAVTPEAVAGAASTWVEAFDQRCAVADHAGTATIIQLVAREDPALAERLAERRNAAMAEAGIDLGRSRARLRAALDAGRRNGLVDETDAADIEARLLRAEQPGRDDLGLVRVEIDQIGDALATAADHARVAFIARLETLRATSHDLDAAVFVTAERLAQQGDLATAEETLIQGIGGAEPVTEHQPSVNFSEFFPAVVDALPGGVTPELIEAVAARTQSAGSLDFSGLSSDAAESAAVALHRWREVARGDRRHRLRADLSPALRLLGIGSGGDRPSPNLPHSAERVWLDLTGVDRTGQRLVPAFGSAAGSEQRVLLVWRQPSPETLLSYLEQDPSDRSVIVLYFGTLTVVARRDLAGRLRGSLNKAVVVVDDAVLAWATSKATGTFEVTMRATLPFSAVNPYQTGHGGSVPEEMFYGRVAERQAVIAEAGTNLIYGGRRLGKSALLLEAGRRFEETPNQLAIYVDLDTASIRTTRRAEGLWDLVARKLLDRNPGTTRPGRRRTSNQETVQVAVRSWLDGRPTRRMLLLLDECDAFFDVDGANNFAVTRTLKEMMERDRRFKVVFAGLHQVQRFATIPNQPFAHLGKSVPIGPLAPRYGYSLLAKPLLALGWDLAPELASRVLAYTNYLPILLQEVGHALVSSLQSRPVEGPVPATITTADIEGVLASESLARAIKERFTLTLNLDPRYTVIAYVVAIDALDDGVERTVAARELRSRCRDYWPAGFADVREDEFRSLLEELVGLGILARAGSEYRMRSPNVLRLLGSREEIEDKLLEVAESTLPPANFAAGDSHRVLDTSTGKRSPFTETQLADVIGRDINQLRIVVGTDATYIGSVREALTVTERDTASFTLRNVSRPATFTRALDDVPERHHYVVLSDLRDVSEDNVRKAVAGAESRMPMAPGATRSVVLLISPDQLPLAESARAGGLTEVVVPLDRYSDMALSTWALDVEGGFSDSGTQRAIAEVTGGWPILLDRLAAAGQRRGAARALESIRAELTADPALLLRPLGLADSGLIASTWAQLVDLLSDGGADAETIAELLEPEEGVDAAAALRAVTAAGLLPTDRNGLLAPERVASACWSTARANG